MCRMCYKKQPTRTQRLCGIHYVMDTRIFTQGCLEYKGECILSHRKISRIEEGISSIPNTNRSQIGMVINKRNTAEHNASNDGGIPSVNLLLTSLAELPIVIKLPTWDGGEMEQKLEFCGFPNQCFFCRQLGHYVQECPKRKEIKQPETRMQQQKIEGENERKMAESSKMEHSSWMPVKGKTKRNLMSNVDDARAVMVIPMENKYNVLQNMLAEKENEGIHLHGNEMVASNILDCLQKTKQTVVGAKQGNNII